MRTGNFIQIGFVLYDENDVEVIKRLGSMNIKQIKVMLSLYDKHKLGEHLSKIERDILDLEYKVRNTDTNFERFDDMRDYVALANKLDTYKENLFRQFILDTDEIKPVNYGKLYELYAKWRDNPCENTRIEFDEYMLKFSEVLKHD